VVVSELMKDPSQRFLLQQGVEDEQNPGPNLLIRMLLDTTVVAAHQSRRQGKRQFTAFGFAEDSGGQATAKRVHFQLRNCTLVACQITHKLYFFRALLSESANIAAR
jgi:hypothetical protein